LDPYPAADHSSIHQLGLLLSIAPPSGALPLVLLLILLLLSFLIAGNEAALFSLQPKDLDVLRNKQHAEARRIVRLMDHRRELYVTLLMTGTFVNICIILLLNYLLRQWLVGVTAPAWLVSLFIGGWIVLIVYVITRLLPKLWASQQPVRFAHDFAVVAAGLHRLFKGPSRYLLRLAERIAHRAGAHPHHQSYEQKISASADDEADSHSSSHQQLLLGSVIKFGNLSVRQIMRSRSDVSGIEYLTPLSEVLRLVAELHYSRLPVYRGDPGQIVGILNTKDLLPYLQAQDSFDWHRLLRSPYFVPETTLVEELLKEFQQKRIHFAVVVDEAGVTSGIVTMEDILEEVIGDIRDEFDEE
jgi:putative hemolysin